MFIRPLSAGIFLLLCWVNTGCAQETDSKESAGAVHNEVSASEDQSRVSLNSASKAKDFSSFLNDFRRAIVNEDWKQLAEYCSFPLMFRGELDDEGEVLVDEKMFQPVFRRFLSEEIYLNVNDELVSSTYRKVIDSPLQISRAEDGLRVELHGLQFDLVRGQWKLAQVTTYVHIIDQIRDKK